MRRLLINVYKVWRKKVWYKIVLGKVRFKDNGKRKIFLNENLKYSF